jgi:hypothetical protein
MDELPFWFHPSASAEVLVAHDRYFASVTDNMGLPQNLLWFAMRVPLVKCPVCHVCSLREAPAARTSFRNRCSDLSWAKAAKGSTLNATLRPIETC